MLQNDITALGVCLCRHGHIAYLMNAFTGERHAYATLFMRAVLSSIWLLLFVWYDINCRWSHSFLKWLALQTAELKAKAAKLHFPLPRMHYYAHRYSFLLPPQAKLFLAGLYLPLQRCPVPFATSSRPCACATELSVSSSTAI